MVGPDRLGNGADVAHHHAELPALGAVPFVAGKGFGVVVGFQAGARPKCKRPQLAPRALPTPVGRISGAGSGG